MGFMDKFFGRPNAPGTAQGASQPAPPPPAAPEPAQPEPRDLSSAELQAMLDQPGAPLVIDVRETQELIAEGWIPGAVHMPMSSFQGREGELNQEQPIVLYCAGGMRSYDVGCYLLDKGFKDIANLNGGIRGWAGPRSTGTPPA